MKSIVYISIMMFVFFACKKDNNLDAGICDDYIISNKDTIHLEIGEGFNTVENSTYILHASAWNYDYLVWSTGDTANSITVSKPSSYSVFAYNNLDQLVDSAFIGISIYPAYIQVPNSFTPDGDWHNDIWHPIVFNICKESYSTLVYDAANVLIFQSNNPDIGWDGTYIGAGAPQGYYTYQIQAINIFGETITKKGTINLLR